MIEFTIEVPFVAMQTMTPKMILGNYIQCDDRLRKVECDRMLGYCDVEISPYTDINNNTSCYKIRATYRDLEAEMITKLVI
jgi:hypothetical protein